MNGGSKIFSANGAGTIDYPKTKNYEPQPKN